MRIIKRLLQVILLLLIVLAGALFLFREDIRADYEAYRKTAVPALMYHSISTVPPRWSKDMCIEPGLFRQQLQYLKDHGYKVITASEARRRLLAGEDVERNIVLTFDDGYANNYTVAYPMLKEYGFKGTFFAIGKKVGEPGYMTYPQMKEMHFKGKMEIGSHSMSHDPLDVIEPGYLPWEIYQPMNLFSDEMNFYIHGIAYPNGAYNDAVIAEIRKYPRFHYAFSGRPGCNTREIVERTPFQLRRVGVYDRGHGIDDFESLLRKCYIEGYLDSKGFPVDRIQALRDKVDMVRRKLAKEEQLYGTGK